MATVSRRFLRWFTLFDAKLRPLITGPD